MGNALLMRKNMPILEFNIDSGYYNVLNAENMPIRLKSAVKTIPGKESDPQKTLSLIASNRDVVIDYLANRVLDLTRENAKKILDAYQLTQSQNPSDKAKIALTYHAVSMGDTYWVQNKDQSYSWEEMDPKKTPLSMILTRVALHGRSITLREKAGIPPMTAELNGKGSYAHAWIRGEDEENYFLKKSTKGGNESAIEISASNILDCFNIPHVKYEKAEFEKAEGYEITKCKNMATDRLDIISAEDFYCYCNRNGKDFIKEALAIDSDTIYKMCITDYLLSNPDRHLQNWGFYEENEHGTILCCHPLFDHNNAFDESLMEDPQCGISRVFPEISRKEAAERAIKQVPIKCFMLVQKQLFINDQAYESFMERASLLGLYKKINLSFWQKIFKPDDLFEPVTLSKPIDEYSEKLQSRLEEAEIKAEENREIELEESSEEITDTAEEKKEIERQREIQGKNR